MDVKSCRVGVPVSSIIKGSVGEDIEVGLVELIRDETEKGDKSIGKMVAKVGRWWWQDVMSTRGLRVCGSMRSCCRSVRSVVQASRSWFVMHRNL